MSVAIQETLCSRRKFMELCGATGGAAVAASLYLFFQKETFALDSQPLETSKPPLPKPPLESAQAQKVEIKPQTQVKIPESQEIRPVAREATLESTPFFSQFNPELPEEIRSMGCGPISLAMVLAYRKKINPDLRAARNVVRRAHCLGLWSPNGTNTANLEELAKTYGISADHKSLNNLGELKQLLETSQNPVIVGYHVNGNLGEIGHLILVLAVDQEKGLVYTNDSAATPHEDGENRAYDLATFEAAWNSQGRWVVGFGKNIETTDAEGFPIYLLPSVLEWKEKIKEWSKEYSLDVRTIATLMQLESAGNPDAVSSSNAQGLFQVMPDKFTEAEDGKHFNPDINAKRGLGYFIECKARATSLGYKGIDNLVQAAQGYNGGINVVGKDISGEANLFQKRFRGFYTGDHTVIDEFYYHYATHLR